MLQPASNAAMNTAPASLKAFFALGFRPFYLLGTLFAAASIVLWSFYWSGAISLEPALSGSLWHAHEMIFGFVLAIVVGFLLTAVRVWTKQETPSGLSLAPIVGLWVLARIFMVTGELALTAVTNISFLLLTALAIAGPIIKSQNWRNLFAPVLLVIFALIDFAIFAYEADVITVPDISGLPIVASDLVTLLVALIGGRVIPFFTKNALPHTKPRQDRRVEVMALGSLLLIGIVDIAKLFDQTFFMVEFFLLALAFTAHSVRLYLWQPLATIQTPLLWILVLSYAWLPVAILLRVLSLFEMIEPVLAMHALFSGLISGLIIGMMTRTARGHTGRALVAGPVEIIMYASVHIAAVVRVFFPVIWPEHVQTFISISAFIWAAVFLTFAISYGPSLVRPRPDGRPG